MTVQRGGRRTKGLPVVAFTQVHTAVNAHHGRTRYVLAVCPFGAHLHLHRWPLGAAEPGERTAHCGGGRYLLGASR